MTAVPDVSVIMPTHNAERFVAEALGDLAKQAFDSFEVVVVDDGSVDSTVDIVSDFCSRDERFRLVCQDCSGAAIARNRGFEESVGEYVVFLDADDRFDVNFLRLMRQGLDDPQVDVAVCSADSFESDGRGADDYIRIPGGFVGIHDVDDYGDNLFLLCSTVPWNKMVRRTYLSSNGIAFQDIPVNNDVFYSCMLLARARSIFAIPEPLVRYRIFSGNSLQDKRSKHPQCGLIASYEVLAATIIERSKKPTLSRGLNSLFVNTFFYSIYAALERPDGYEIALGVYEGWIEKVRALDDGNGGKPIFASPKEDFKYSCLMCASFDGIVWACSGFGDHRNDGIARRVRLFAKLALARAGFRVGRRR